MVVIMVIGKSYRMTIYIQHIRTPMVYGMESKGMGIIDTGRYFGREDEDIFIAVHRTHQ